MQFYRTILVFQGLTHIQQRLGRPHSRLRSTVCVVDSRFSCKIADYGLPTFHPTFLSSRTDLSKLAWTAPELLAPIMAGQTLAEGTLGADMFSFGVIAWEVVARRSVASVNLYEDGGKMCLRTAFEPGFKPPMPKETDVHNDVVSLVGVRTYYCYEQGRSRGAGGGAPRFSGF